MISCRNTWTDSHDADLVQFDQVRAAIPALKRDGDLGLRECWYRAYRPFTALHTNATLLMALEYILLITGNLFSDN